MPAGWLTFCGGAGVLLRAAERGWVWCRRWQGAVRVVDCKCRRIEDVQFRYVGPINPFLILSKCSICRYDNDWVGVSGN